MYKSRMNNAVKDMVKLKVDLKDLDNTTKNTLSFFFKANLCDFAELNSNNKNVDIFILDYDRKVNRQLIDQLARNNQYAIMLHSRNIMPTIDNNRVQRLVKPIRANLLKHCINSIHSKYTNNHSDKDEIVAVSTIDPPLTSPITNIKQQEKLNDIHENTKLRNNYISSLSEDEIRTAIDNSTENLNGIYNKQITQNNAEKNIPKSSMQTSSAAENPEPKKTYGNSHLSMAMQGETDKDTLNRYKAHKHVGSNPDIIDLNNPDQLEMVYHTPEKYLYYHLARAVKRANKKKSDVRIQTVFGSILFEFKTQLFHHAFTGTKLKYIKSSPLFNKTDCSFIEIKSEALQAKKHNKNAREMIWNSAILASKGRVPRGTDLNLVIEMECWPNFTNLNIFRYVVQITSAWSRHNLSLLDTAKQLEIPQRYVFTLYNAIQAIGCAKMSASKKHNFSLGKKGRSVFSKILSHIFSK